MKNRFIKVSFIAAAALILTGCTGVSDVMFKVSDVSVISDISAESSIDTPEQIKKNHNIKDTAEKIFSYTDDEDSAKELKSSEITDHSAMYDSLIINTNPAMYTYDDLAHDTHVISELYADYLTVDSIGTTADGRELYHFVIGSPNAGKQIFINGAIHGREYLTAQLVMKQMMIYLQNITEDNYYGEVSYHDMWENVSVHVVPLVNPDGMTISQFGIDGLNSEEIKQNIYNIAQMDQTEPDSYYLDRWKANAMGVDLNRNFDALWDEYYGTDHPSSDHYKGIYTGSEPESSALINLTDANDFLYTISYHTQGQIIYWNFANIEPIYDIAYTWAAQLSASTGYGLINDYQSVDAAGYSDWCIYRRGIPSVVIEAAYGESPYLADQFNTVLEQNKEVWEITIINAMNR